MGRVGGDAHGKYVFTRRKFLTKKLVDGDVSQVLNMQYMFWGGVQVYREYYSMERRESVISITYSTQATAFSEKFACDDQYSGPVHSCECKSKLYCLTDAMFYDAVRECLAEDPVAGLCEKYGLRTMRFGVMPKWNTRWVTNMNGENETTSTLIGFAGKSEFNGDLSNWGHVARHDHAQNVLQSFRF